MSLFDKKNKGNELFHSNFLEKKPYPLYSQSHQIFRKQKMNKLLSVAVFVAPREGFEPSRPNGSQADRSRRHSRHELPFLESAPYQISRKTACSRTPRHNSRIAFNGFFSLFEKNLFLLVAVPFLWIYSTGHHYSLSFCNKSVIHF